MDPKMSPDCFKRNGFPMILSNQDPLARAWGPRGRGFFYKLIGQEFYRIRSGMSGGRRFFYRLIDQKNLTVLDPVLYACEKIQ